MPTQPQSRRSLLRSTLAASVAAVVAKVLPARARAAEATGGVPSPVVAKAHAGPLVRHQVSDRLALIQDTVKPLRGWLTVYGDECPPAQFELSDWHVGAPQLRCEIVNLASGSIVAGHVKHEIEFRELR